MSHDHMRQATAAMWSIKITRKTMTLELNQEGTKQKYTYQKRFTTRS